MMYYLDFVSNLVLCIWVTITWYGFRKNQCNPKLSTLYLETFLLVSTCIEVMGNVA